jgi:sterol desaturase/sphingolipid hydroxylase (fatty acid hydroxylase superfamily)
MKNTIANYLLFLCVGGSFGAFLLGYNKAANLELIVLLASVFTLVVAIIFERIIPYRREWNIPQGDTRTDLTSAAVLVGVIDPVIKAVAPIVVVALVGMMSVNLRPSALGNMPFLIQVLAVTLLIEFGRYWSHRLHHALKSFWWLHAMHHSSKRLYALNNLRFHPLNYLNNFLIGVLPAMLLGFSAEALLAYLAISQPVLMLQHANIDLKSGWLNYVFSTNELHRAHHSTESHIANSNFGNAFVLWDQVFGTYRPVDNNESTLQVGLFAASSAYPQEQSYFAQLRSMFSPTCCRG